MKHIHYIYIGALAFLIACSSEERMTTDSNEKPSGPIELSAGIIEGSSKATTRTPPTYQALAPNTKLALQVSGTWTGHDPVSVVKTTTATIGTASETNNAVNFTPAETLYWDDYGTADANNTTGRTTGLTIYGAAINGKTTTADAGVNYLLVANADWTALSWTLPTDQRSLGSQPADKDLLISNNVKASPGEGTYKFTEKTSGKLLKFTHALSKITVVLTANNGFPGGSGNEAFEDDPQVTLTSNEAGQSTNAEWAYRTGNINVTNGAVSSQQDLSAINMYQATAKGHTVSFEALVMPGSQFGSNDNDIIARINADGNIYYVTAANIRDKIAGDSKVTEAGKNYIINVTVDKTGISNVSATVANWTDISADNVAPVINLVGQLGGSASNWEADKSFSFYRSTALNEGYSSNPALLVNSCYKEESVLNFTNSSQTWSMSPVLYWPNHNTHYQFRAVWPRTVTTADDENFTDPRVVSGVNHVAGLQIIKVKNVAYSGGSFPSDLMIARPNVANVAGNCGSNESDVVHPKKNLYTEGICARTGAINLTFNYMMSKVGVNLSTKENSSDPDYVNLTNAKVEIVNVYNNGDVILGNRTVNCGNYSKNSYILDVGASANNRLSAIVPQTFTYSSALASGNTKLRITIYNNGDTNSIDDIYEADLKTIPVQEGSSPAAAVDGWESGKYYVYNLRLTKTKVQVTASLTPWTEVTATQDIWF